MQAHACIARKAVSIAEAQSALWWSLSKAAREVAAAGAEATVHRLHRSMDTGRREAPVGEDRRFATFHLGANGSGNKVKSSVRV
jgi:hypothetical protein